MVDSRNAPNAGMAVKVNNYLAKRIGETVPRHQLRTDLQVTTPAQNSGLMAQLKSLEIRGMVRLDRTVAPAATIVLPNIVNHHIKAKPKNPPKRGFYTKKKTKTRKTSGNVAGAVEAYLKGRVGHTISRIELLAALNLTTASQKNCAVNKLSVLEKRGKVSRDKSIWPPTITALPAINEDNPGRGLAKPKKTISQLFNQPPILTPQPAYDESILQAPQLDLAGIQHQLTQIDHLNKAYRHGLEQIALILEQLEIIVQPK